MGNYDVSAARQRKTDGLTGNVCSLRRAYRTCSDDGIARRVQEPEDAVSESREIARRGRSR